MSLNTYLLFVLACAGLVAVPGPDMAYLLARTAAEGRRAGSVAVLGISTACYIHLLAVVSGLSGLLLASATAFTVVKWLGAAYLCYLGVVALGSRKASVSPRGELVGRSLRAIFWQAFWSSALNPKVAIFYIALLPQFVGASSRGVTMQLVLLGMTESIVALALHLLLVAGAARLTGRLRRNARLALWLQRAMGTLFLGLGARLVFQKTHA